MIESYAKNNESSLRYAPSIASRELKFDISHIFEASKSVPLNLSSLAYNLQIKLYYVPMDYELASYIDVNYEECSIYINSNHTLNRQRFSAAHAIGHYVFDRKKLLKHGGCNDTRDYQTSSNHSYYNPDISKTDESRANGVAVMMLMPEEILLNLYKMYPENITGIADILGVSEKALTIRLEKVTKRNGLEMPHNIKSSMYPSIR